MQLSDSEQAAKARVYYWSLPTKIPGRPTLGEASYKLCFLRMLSNGVLSHIGVQDVAMCKEIAWVSHTYGKQLSALRATPEYTELEQKVHQEFLSLSDAQVNELKDSDNYKEAVLYHEQLAEEATRRREEDEQLLSEIRAAVDAYKKDSSHNKVLVAYKFVNDKLESPWYSPALKYTPKTYVEVSTWDSNFSAQCAAGIHVAGLNWARGNLTYKDTSKVVKVSFLASDVVGFPLGSDKLRVKKVFVEGIVE